MKSIFKLKFKNAKIKKRQNQGIMRIIEAMLACIILFAGITMVTQFSTYGVNHEAELNVVSEEVISTLDNTEAIERIIRNDENWLNELKAQIRTILPIETYYKLTIDSALTGESITSISDWPNEESEDLNKISITKIVPISLSESALELRKLDVVLIIDRSGSMDYKEPGDKYSKIYYARNAAKTFIDQLNASKDRVGLVSFSTTASLDIELTSDFSSVKNKIGRLWASGYTNIGDGIKKATDELVDKKRSDSILVEILLTDGVANRSCNHRPQHSGETCPYAKDYAFKQAQIAKENNIRLYSIGLGADTKAFNEDLLKDIQTNGYYYAPSAEDLQDIYLAIAQDLLLEIKYEIVIINLHLQDNCRTREPLYLDAIAPARPRVH